MRRSSCWPRAPRAICSPRTRSSQARAARRTAGARDAARWCARASPTARASMCFSSARRCSPADAARALRMLAGLRAEGTEATLVLWALARALRDVWNALRAGDRARARLAARRRGARARAAGARRASPSRALAARAARADRMIKGRLAGDAWDELALLAARAVRHAGAAAPPRCWRRSHVTHAAHRRSSAAPSIRSTAGICARRSSCGRSCSSPRCAFCPTGSPPHRDQLYASAELRLQMVQAAVADQPGFVVDDREVRRSGVSYSVDTLTELRREYPHALAVPAARHGCVSRPAALASLARAPDARAHRGGAPPGLAGPDHRPARAR